MHYTEEVFKNGEKWYGAHTGKEYPASRVEKKGGENWSKPEECEEHSKD